MKINGLDVRLTKGVSQPAINFSYSNGRERSYSTSSLNANAQIGPMSHMVQVNSRPRQVDLKQYQMTSPLHLPVHSSHQASQQTLRTFTSPTPTDASGGCRPTPSDFMLSPQHSVAQLSTAPTSVNLLRQDRVMTVDESDYKLELEVMKIKYQTLSERYESLEAELADVKVKYDRIQKR